MAVNSAVTTNRLATQVAAVAARSGNTPAIIEFEHTTSYAELNELARTIAGSMIAIGIRRGDRVGCLLGNRLEWVVMALGASYIGATFVPINTWYKSTEIAWTLEHCRISLLVCTSGFLKANFTSILLELVPESRGAGLDGIRSQRFPSLKSVVFLGADESNELVGWSDFFALGQAVSTTDLEVAAAQVRGDDTAFVLYTSGSTADPKGVLLNNQHVLESGIELGRKRNIQSDDRVWLGSPLFYGLGATNALPATLGRGAALVLQDFFEAERAMLAIEQSQASVYYGTGNMTRAILDHPSFSKKRIGSLRKGNAGTVTEYKRLTLIEMGIEQAVPAYGLTECYGNATVGDPDDSIEAKLETSGSVVDGMELRIVHPDTDEELSTGQVGRVLLRGRVTPGYLNNAEETAKVLRADGYFDTGDLGSLDCDGRFRFHARLKEVIKRGGINISPLEVEQVIATHPHVREAFIVGVDEPGKEQVVVAFVDAETPLSADEIRAYVKERVASFKTPDYVFFRDESELPRLASGKVAKHRLAEEAKQELLS